MRISNGQSECLRPHVAFQFIYNKDSIVKQGWLPYLIQKSCQGNKETRVMWRWTPVCDSNSKQNNILCNQVSKSKLTSFRPEFSQASVNSITNFFIGGCNFQVFAGMIPSRKLLMTEAVNTKLWPYTRTRRKSRELALSKEGERLTMNSWTNFG